MSFIYEQYEQYEQIVKNKGNYSVHMSVHTVHTSRPFAPGAVIIGYLPTSPQFHANSGAGSKGIARSMPIASCRKRCANCFVPAACRDCFFQEVREGVGAPF